MTNKNLYLITYSLLHGETMSHGHECFKHAYSEKQAWLLFRKEIGSKKYKRCRLMRIEEKKREVMPTMDFEQLSMFGQV